MRSRKATLQIGAAAVVLVAALVFGGAMILGPLAGGGPAASPSPSRSVTAGASLVASVNRTPGTTAAATATFGPTLSPPPSPTESAPPSVSASPVLPSLLGAIGDSYSQGYNVSPQHRYDNPAFSWVVGSSRGDGVYSVRERLAALGARLTVVDAATSGKKMSDAPRQAASVVAAARKLGAGQTAYVTFELGTNDLCDDAKTDPADFEAQLVAAISILRGGLPAGSRILMLPIPDFDHFRSITQADSQAVAALSLDVNSRDCAPFLGSNGPRTVEEAMAAMAAYDSILQKACDGIESTDGAAGRLHCRTDEALLSERDFEIRDLSTVDYFHPSISGQAKIAAAAWNAGVWAAIKLPAGG